MARRTLTIAAILLGAAASGPALTAGYATWSARAAVARLMADNKALSVGGTDVDPFGGRLTLHDVAMTTGSLRVYARTLSLPLQGPRFGIVTSALAADRPIQVAQWPTGDKPQAPPAPVSASPFGGGIQLKIPSPTVAPAPAPVPPATAATNAASASDVTIVHGATTYTIKKIDVSGTALTSADLVALLDPKTPESIATRLRKLNAGSIVISEITSDNKTSGAENHASLTQILLANVVAGKIGAASAAGGTVSGLGKNGGILLKTGAIQASGLDVALLERMIDAVRTDDAEPLKTLSESLTVSDLSLTDSAKHTALTISTIAQKGLKARPLKTDLRTINDDADKNAAAPDTVKTERMKALLDDISASFEVGALSIDKIAASNSEKDETSTMGVARIALDDYRARKLAAFTVRDFLFQGPSVKLGFATLDLADIAIPAVGKSTDAATSQPLATDAVPSIAKADMSLIDVDTTTTQSDGTTSKVKFKLAHVGSSSDQRFGKLPSRGALAVDNLTFDLPDGDSPGARELLAMGYKHLDVSGAIATTYDQTAETLSVQKMVISGVDMGAVSLALDLGNVAKGILSANQSVAKASALAMLLKRVDLHVANSGLFDKALDWKAKQDGKSVEDERANAIELVSTTLPQALGNGPGIKTIGAAVAAFIAEPKTLHIVAASKEGLGVADMGLIGTPDALLNRLDIQADANK